MLGDWVVKDVLLPMDVPGENYHWDEAIPLGDLDSDGMADFLVAGDSLSRSGLAWHSGWSTRGAEIDVPSVSTLHFYSGLEPLATVLRRPQGFALLVEDARTTPSFQHRLFDVVTGQLLGTIPYPLPPAPGLPPIGFLGAVQRAGDVNVDGFEDAFFQTYTGSWCVTGLLDGKTMTVAWQHYLPSAGGGTALTSCSRVEGWPDLDGDGAPDLVYCTQRYYPPATFERTMQALSGSTGALIWSRTFSDADTAGAVGDDVTGDGIPEMLFSSSTYGSLHCLDGATGATVWSAPISAAQGLLPPSFSTHYYRPAMAMARSAVTGTLEVVVDVTSIDTQTAQYETGYLHLEASSGAAVAYRATPVQDLLPWVTDPVSLEPGAQYAVGDIDRDGTVEMAARNATPSLGSPQSAGLAMATVLWAPCTLQVSASVPAGGTLGFKTRIPFCPGRTAMIVMSRGFDAEQGVVHGDWPLQLEFDGLFRLTTSMSGGTPPLWLMLDGTGYAETQVSIPANAAYVGSVLYSKVVVPELSQPKGIYTTSTLGVTTITL